MYNIDNKISCRWVYLYNSHKAARKNNEQYINSNEFSPNTLLAVAHLIRSVLPWKCKS